MNDVTAQELLDAYRDSGGVWETAAALGLTGAQVHQRLAALGVAVNARRWSDAEAAELARQIENLVPLGEIARRLGRPYAGVATKASELGIKSAPRRERKIPRGAGYDKASMKHFIVQLWNFDGSLVQFVRSRGLQIEPFVQAFQAHYPAAWADYTQLKGQGERKTCPYCEDEFFPMIASQVYCTKKCSGDARRDEEYFGGNRRMTVGLRAGVCQLCGGARAKGMSSHHVLGKANDPENRVLIALCRGCHELVSRLGTRTFTADPAAWEALISLVWMRRNADSLKAGQVVHVNVEIATEAADVAPELMAA